MRRLPLLALLLAAVVVAPHAEAKSLRFTYLPSTGVYSDLQNAVSSVETPAGRVAALGYFRFVPTRSSFTLLLDDLGSRSGETLQVWVLQYKSQTRCVPVGRATTFSGLRPGSQVQVHVVSDADTLGRRSCTGHSAGGTAYVQL